MNTYHFLITAPWPRSKAKRRKAIRIAQEEGAWLIEHKDGAYIFGKRNQGSPFDEAVADSIRARFIDAGIQ